MSEATLWDLSDDEIAEVLLTRRPDNCADGMCGGCPRCGVTDKEDESCD
jgi:hypothetical protein